MLSARLTGGCIAQASQISVGLQRSERILNSFTISSFFFCYTGNNASSFFHFFEGTFVGGGKKSIKTKRKGEINDKNRRYNALFAIMATILCTSIFNLRSYTIEMGSIVRQRLVLFTCRHLQLEKVTPRA